MTITRAVRTTNARQRVHAAACVYGVHGGRCNAVAGACAVCGGAAGRAAGHKYNLRRGEQRVAAQRTPRTACGACGG